MKVLVTGAFGNIGRGTVEELVRRGHEVRCFDLGTRENLRRARELGASVEVVWGDLRRPEDLETAVAGVETVVHLAFVIPKLSVTGVDCEDQPDLAWEVNVGGTRNLLEAMKIQGVPRIIFASSLHIYGITQDTPPPRRVSDPVKPMDSYARHKVECERLVRSSGLTWSVFRFAAALPFSLKLDRAMFEIPLRNRMEYVHHLDVGVALARGVSCPGVWGRILHIGGGPRCQYTYGEIVGKIMAAVGVGDLPESAFSRKPFSTDWIDTQESQRLLDYQRLTLDDYVHRLAARLGFLRPLVRMFRPLVRALLLRRSPYYRTRKLHDEKERLRGRLALVACGATSFGEAVARKLGQEGLRVLLLQGPGEDLGPLCFQLREEGGQAEVVAVDLSSGRRVLSLFQELRERCGLPDVLVGFADLVWLSAEGELDPGRSWERIESGVLGTLRLSELVVSEMRTRERGHLILIEPALKLFPVRPPALLQASRAFFSAFSRRLARETRGTPVRVSLVRVGIPTTELFRIRRLLSIRSRQRRYGVEVRPEALANRVWTLLVRPQPVVYVPQLMAFFSWLDSYAGWLVELIRGRLALRPATIGG